MGNPFSVKTPEDLEAAEALRLFVDVFTDFYKIREPGHAMLNGQRGSGKSMMFRFLQPDCQMLAQGCSFHALSFLGVLVSIKNTDLKLTELQRLEDRHAAAVLNEHFLCMYIASRIFLTLSTAPIEDSESNRKEIVEVLTANFYEALERSGWLRGTREAGDPEVGREPAHLLNVAKALCDRLFGEVIRYVKLIAFDPSTLPSYRGALCGYLDFLYPLLEAIRQWSFMPKGPVYLLIDDADYLNETQTMVLNSWLSTRTGRAVSIKVSTQLRYKTYRTFGGMRVSAPHDYSEVNISDIYTSRRGKYLNRVEEIVKKRLEVNGILKTPREFFPADDAQEKKIVAIEDKLRASWPKRGRGYRPSDDVVRYSRPIFISRLKGRRKSGSTYSYAGFEQLVHISSGLIRYFLEAAALMYGEEEAFSNGEPVLSIRPRIQNDVIRNVADDLMMKEFDRLFDEDMTELWKDSERAKREQLKQNLHNLIKALGMVFHQKLLSEDSERRVFSVAFSDRPDPDLAEVFKLGVEFGYFQQSSIGNKDGTGRTPLYILTRRLAPHFTLDPTGFAGYLFVTNDKMKEAIANPDAFLRRVKKAGVKAMFEERQLQLFG